MKFINILLVVLFWIGSNVAKAQMAIGGAVPHPSAGLDIISSNKGLLLPRVSLVSTGDPNTVFNVADALLIYNTNPSIINGQNVGFYYNTNVEFNKLWNRWATGAPLTAIWNRNGNRFNVNDNPFLGTTDNQPLRFRVNNQYVGMLQHAQMNIFFTGANKTAVSGTHNTAWGHQALNGATTGSSNLAIGNEALLNNTTGSRNVAIGGEASRLGVSMSDNTAVGFGALRDASNSNMVAMGVEVLKENVRIGNTGFGFRALSAIKTNAANPGTYSNQYLTAVGNQALQSILLAQNTTAFGSGAMENSIETSINIAIGSNALRTAGVTAVRNIAVGSNAMIANTGAADNIAIGFDALKSVNNQSSLFNVAVGHGALAALQVSSNNTAVGVSAGGSISSSSNSGQAGNTAVGAVAMAQLTDRVFSTAVGFAAFITGNHSNATALGNGAAIPDGNAVRIGNNSVTSIGGFAAFTNLSDGRAKTSVQSLASSKSFIMGLRPVNYRWDQNAIKQLFTFDNYPAGYQIQEERPDNNWHTGFIAQEVSSATGADVALKDIVDDGAVLGIRYALMVVPLVKTIQEQQHQLAGIQKLISELEQQLEVLKNIH
jgi:trimeric autotransporter adhesin